MNHSSDTNPFRLTIIEDNRFVRSGWEALFKDAHEIQLVGVYESCEEAFAGSEVGETDVVLMDIGLPGMSGIDGVKYIKKNYPKVAVVMCTVYDDDQKVFDAICAGAVGYLLKKSSPAELIQAVKDAASEGSPMTPNIARKIISVFQRPATVSRREEDALTDRELEVLEKMAQGKSYAAIGQELFLSVDGIRYHIRHIYEKLQVHSRGEAVAHGMKNGLIPPLR